MNTTPDPSRLPPRHLPYSQRALDMNFFEWLQRPKRYKQMQTMLRRDPEGNPYMLASQISWSENGNLDALDYVIYQTQILAELQGWRLAIARRMRYLRAMKRLTPAQRVRFEHDSFSKQRATP